MEWNNTAPNQRRSYSNVLRLRTSARRAEPTQCRDRDAKGALQTQAAVRAQAVVSEGPEQLWQVLSITTTWRACCGVWIVMALSAGRCEGYILRQCSSRAITVLLVRERHLRSIGIQAVVNGL